MTLATDQNVASRMAMAQTMLEMRDLVFARWEQLFCATLDSTVSLPEPLLDDGLRITSMPGLGVRTAARLLTEVAAKAFASAAHLAAYAGLAPVTSRAGSSIRGEHRSRRGNKVLKRALFLSAFAALRDPVSLAYYARKISQGKRHNQALIALARRRCDVMYAMMRDGTVYCPAPLITA